MKDNPFLNFTISSLNSIETVRRIKGETLIVNQRFSYAVSFCLSGKITYTHNGKNFVSDPNHAILLPMGQSYSLHCDESGLFPVINFYNTDDFDYDDLYTVKLNNPTPYINDYDALMHLNLLNRNDSRIKSLSVLYNILSRLASEEKHYDRNPSLTLALDYIENNLSAPDLNITELAKISHISEVYLRRLFNAEFDMSPKQYVTSLRISKAQQLLSSTDAPVSSIAERCGFSSVYHFSRAFKLVTGYTPTEYRAQQLKMML